MGFNTAAIILNDQLSSLRTAGAGECIYGAVVDPRGDGWTGIGVTVLPSRHADEVQIVAVGGNSIRSIGYGHWRDNDLELLRGLAKQLGYRLVKAAPTLPSKGGA